MSRRKQRNWNPGQYEGISPDQVRAQVGISVPKKVQGLSSDPYKPKPIPYSGLLGKGTLH